MIYRQSNTLIKRKGTCIEAPHAKGGTHQEGLLINAARIIIRRHYYEYALVLVEIDSARLSLHRETPKEIHL